MMIGVADIGNTNIKFACFSKGKLKYFESYKELPDKLFSAKKWVVSSVSPKRENEFVKKYNITDPIKINYSSPFSFKNKYLTPDSVGIDRLCGIEGVSFILEERFSKTNVLTIDCGTATTINYKNNENEFIGGLIFPGITLMRSALHLNTSALPISSLTGELPLIGSTTDDCINSGIINSTLALIEKVYNHIFRDDIELKVFLTGGNSSYLLDVLKIPFSYIPYLNLLGIYSLTKKI